MIIRGSVVVKGAYCHIQHAVVFVGILKDELISLTGREGLCIGTWCYEHAVVEVALVHTPHICQAEYDNTCHHGNGLDLTPTVNKQNQGAHHNNDEAAHGICREHGLTHLAHVCEYLSHHVLRNIARTDILLHVHLVGSRDVVAKEHIGHQPEEEAHTAGESKSY